MACSVSENIINSFIRCRTMAYCSIKSVIYKYVAFCLTLTMMFGYFIILYAVLSFSAGQMPAPPPAEQEEYVLNFDSPVYVCADDVSQDFVDANNVEVKRHNETTSFMTGSFTFLKEIGLCTVVGLVVEKESNGRVEVMMTHDICDLCAEIGPDSSYYKYLKYFGFPDSCPFEVGEYRIHDFLTDTDDLPVNRANEARYCVTLNFYQNPDCDCKDNREFLGCLKLDFVIEPM